KLVAEISTDFVAGNIGSEEAVKDTITVIEEVSGFRVGIGGGSICTTPEVTGAYAPTLWAVASVRDALEELGLDVPIIADGGIRTAGDVVKALAAGANTVMLGYMLAGTDEAASPLIAIGNEYYKLYRGMASRGAIERRFAVDRYARTGKRVPEGVEGLVPYKGSIYNVVRGLVEAVRAGLGYAGARNIKELWVKARFISSRRGERGIIYRALGE
ncbi:MAG: IMP dehydrogenase, partial [Desulfurococcaceae archaeon]